MAPDHKSEKWLLYCLNSGYSQREMAKMANVSTPTIRLWLKKYNIKWRTISEGLLVQSHKISARSKKIWSDKSKRAAQSEKMIKVQANRKTELSISAKKNWANNYDKIIAGIRRAAADPARNKKISEISKLLWQDQEYQQKISHIMHDLWADNKYRDKTTDAIRVKCSTPEFAKSMVLRYEDKDYYNKIINILKDRCNDPEYLKKMSEISARLWQNESYREKLLQNSEQRRNKISETLKRKWDTDDTYRSKCETGIDSNKFLKECLSKFGDRFNYDSTRLLNWKTKIEIKCSTCNNLLSKYPQSHIEYGYCEYCKTTSGERTIYEFIKSKGINCTVRDRSIISPLELDIYIPHNQSAIEYHGLYWHSFNSLETTMQKKKHYLKMDICRNNNIKLLQFYDFELLNKQEIVKSMILNTIGLSKPLDARKLQIIDKIPPNFFNKNHLAGNRSAKINISLTDGNEVLMAMSFNGHNDNYEIIRMASKNGFRIRGGASKLLSYFIKKFRPKSIHTFANLRYATGNVYKSIGFGEVKETQPGYFYYRRNTILSRLKCQKHKLQQLLGDGFNPEQSESENMFSNGFRRVWDAGNKKFVMSLT